MKQKKYKLINRFFIGVILIFISILFCYPVLSLANNQKTEISLQYGYLCVVTLPPNEQRSTITNLNDLKNKSISIRNKMKDVDRVARILLWALGLKCDRDVKCDYDAAEVQPNRLKKKEVDVIITIVYGDEEGPIQSENLSLLGEKILILPINHLIIQKMREKGEFEIGEIDMGIFNGHLKGKRVQTVRISAPILTEVPEEKFYGTVLLRSKSDISGIFAATDTDFEPSIWLPPVAIQLGFNPFHWLRLEASANSSQITVKTTPLEKYEFTSYHFSVDPVISILKYKKTMPYARAGFGVIIIDPLTGRSISKFIWNIGLGLDISLAEKICLRLETYLNSFKIKANDFDPITLKDSGLPSDFEDTQYNWGLNFGIRYNF